jgi:hypothetical protein
LGQPTLSGSVGGLLRLSGDKIVGVRLVNDKGLVGLKIKD